MTEPKKNVHETILAVMKDVGAIGKTGFNAQQKVAFRGVEDIVNAVQPVMLLHGLTVHPAKTEHRRSAATFKSGGTSHIIDVIVDYVFTGPDGSTRTVQVAAESSDANDKATAKAMSVAQRTCFTQTFTIPTVEAGPDWGHLFNVARNAGRDALIALRNQGKQANAPAEMFPAIEQALAKIPVEGSVQQ